MDQRHKRQRVLFLPEPIMTEIILPESASYSEFLVHSLERHYSVSYVRTSEEAITEFERRIAKKQHYDLAILGVNLGTDLPNRKGLDVLERIVAWGRETKTILHSVYPEYKRYLLTWEADDFVVADYVPEVSTPGIAITPEYLRHRFMQNVHNLLESSEAISRSRR